MTIVDALKKLFKIYGYPEEDIVGNTIDEIVLAAANAGPVVERDLIPTALSELDNDAGFVTESDLEEPVESIKMAANNKVYNVTIDSNGALKVTEVVPEVDAG